MALNVKNEFWLKTYDRFMFSFRCDTIWKPRSHSENGIEINSALCGKWWWVGEVLKEMEIENISFQVEKYEKH